MLKHFWMRPQSGGRSFHQKEAALLLFGAPPPSPLSLSLSPLLFPRARVERTTRGGDHPDGGLRGGGEDGSASVRAVPAFLCLDQIDSGLGDSDFPAVDSDSFQISPLPCALLAEDFRSFRGDLSKSMLLTLAQSMGFGPRRCQSSLRVFDARNK